MMPDDPRQVLGVGTEANDEDIRAAYLRKVKEFPPDRSPREFEQVRDAYEKLRDPRQRTRTMLLSVDPKQPLVALLEGHASRPKFTGPEPWLAVLREKKS